MATETLDQLAQQLMSDQPQKSLPPVEKWHPELSGDIDIFINQKGNWFHEGDEIKRQLLIKLFSSILKREDDNYYLITPVEKWHITVEDVPFTVVDMEVIQRDGQQLLAFKTSVDDVIVSSKENPLRIAIDSATGEPSPYLMIRSNMEGRINRNTFYRLMEMAESFDDAGIERYRVWSGGVEFVVG